MLALFDEVAQDRRATDEKGLLVLGGYIAIIAIAATALGEDLIRQKAVNVIASVFLALVGLLVVGLERSFRAWRTHYIGVSKELWSELGGMNLPEEVLPRWLTSPRRSHAWGAGNMLIWGTFIPVIGTVMYLVFALWPALTNPGRWALLGAGGLVYLGALWLIYRKAGGPARS